MKKTLFTLAIFSFSLTAINAQSEDYKNVLSLTAGYSLFNAVGAAATGDVSENGTYKATPTLQLSYDHGVSKVFSIGGAVSYNSAKATATDYEWTDAKGKTSIGNYDVSLSRITIGARALFHYGNSGKLDMYSGIRLGVGIWTPNATSSNPDFDPAEEFGRVKSGVAPQVQVIPFALRGYITDNIGIGFETAIGSPYMASLSLTYRMGGSGK